MTVEHAARAQAAADLELCRAIERAEFGHDLADRPAALPTDPALCSCEHPGAPADRHLTGCEVSCG